mmetsp:Transcript_2680/g.3051  ORF Transcript_2680/g.3051 Transcript_2680/m.3051 type:complete len:245 (+) Transcript_2680:153-887(+)|eukprot:CAMPEP_0197847426 /NCGR_PEP_ID=MMETSP1438-20131217/6111_1 /TAXON_ID=1461541 /ORGANISM="Pterosperma sp., Strain CCMP1384" /LENGTH=244 /DNA_ID=CAMNT_0043459343 /DNA_START=119 /DNA_END=853 /DNA_ORIENTATION=-
MSRVFVFTLACMLFAGLVAGSQNPLADQKTAAADYLAKLVKEDPSVVVKQNGMHYRIKSPGWGMSHALPDSPMMVSYKGFLMDGTEIDTTTGSPNDPNDVLQEVTAENKFAGLKDALLSMVEGDVWEVFIPSDLAHGDTGSEDGQIPGGAMVIYIIEFAELKGPGILAEKCNPDHVDECSEKQLDFLLKWMDQCLVSIKAELKQLSKKDPNKLGKIPAQWLRSKIAILRDLSMRENSNPCKVDL